MVVVVVTSLFFFGWEGGFELRGVIHRVAAMLFMLTIAWHLAFILSSRRGRGFIRDICFDENDQKIVQTLISMAHSMGMRVVAEGVEEKDQLELLGELAVDEIQGYLLSKPVEAEALEPMILNPQQFLDPPTNVVQLRP